MKNYAIPQLTSKLYKNPLPIQNKGALSDAECRINGDPFVMKYNGEYFCYSTGMKYVNLLHSTDLVHFEHLGGCIEDSGREDFWAPCVMYLNGRFYMYYSSNPEGEEDNHAHCLRVAVADSPYGPFVFQKQLLDLFSIDPHVIKTDDGKLVMFYAANNYNGTDRNFTGTIVLQDEMIDPYTLAEAPKPAVIPSIKEEMFMENRFGDGRDWYTIEGAFYLKKREKEYLMYSANAFTNPSYFIGYARAEKGLGLNSCSWSKYPNNTDYDPFICQNDKIMGTGHNSVVKAPNNVDDWIIYHGKESENHQTEVSAYREMRIDPIIYGEDQLYTIAPSSELQDAPAEPLYRNLYNGEPGKEVFAFGDWNIKEGCLRQDNRNIISNAYLKDISTENYILEVNTRWHAYHLGGRYGIFAAYYDNQNNVQVILNEGEHTVELYAILNGCQTQVISVKLEKEFDFTAYHKLTIKRTTKLFLIYVDDLYRAKGVYSIGKSTVGLISYYTGTDYASMELTEYLELDQENVSEFAAQMLSDNNTLEKNWSITDNGIVGYAIDSKTLLINQKKSRYRFSVNLEQQLKKQNAYSGIYAAYYDETNYIALLLDTAGKRITVKTCRNGLVNEISAISDEAGPNTITVKRYDNKIIILAGTKTILKDVIDFGDCHCGFYAETRTFFSGIELLSL